MPGFDRLTKGRSNNFDAIRFGLALLVIVTHSYGLLNGPNAQEPLFRITRGQLAFGDLAVDFFFVISGFLITASWIGSSGLFPFLAKRVLRIYPGIVVAILFCLLVVAPLGATHPADYLRTLSPMTFLRSVAELQIPPQEGVFDGQAYPGSLNLSLWTIMYEFLCYLMVTGFGLLGVLKKRPIVLVMFLLALGLYSWQTFAGGLAMLDWRVYPILGQMRVWPRFVTYYTAGMVFYLYWDVIPFRQSIAWPSAAIVALSLKVDLAFALPVFGTYLLMYFAFHERIRLHSVARYGDFSYGMYVYAYPVQQLLIRFLHPSFLHPGLTPLRLFLLSTIVTIPLAIGSWHFIEKPCMRLGKTKRNTVRPVFSLCSATPCRSQIDTARRS